MNKIYYIILPIPSIKCLSFGGGGARGSVYPPVLAYLEKAGTLATVEEVLGVSAGAISAAFLAIGAHPLDLKTIAEQTNFKTIFKHWSIFKGGKGIFYTHEFKIRLGHHLKHFFHQRLQEAKTLCAEKLASTPQRQQQILEKIQQLEQHHSITFIDLHQLRQIYTELGQPNRIKALTIAAVDAHHKKPHIFSSNPHQDSCIVDAIVASSAIPPLFKPHVIKKNGEEKSFIDGCFYNSLMNPSHQSATFVTEMERRLQTLLFLLSPEDEANRYIYGPQQKPSMMMMIIGFLFKLFIGVDIIKAQSIMYKGVHDYGHNVVPMDVDIHPTHFGLPLEKKLMIGQRAIACLERYLTLRKHSGYHLIGTFAECLYQVPFDQFHQAKTAILQQMECNEINTTQHHLLIDAILKHRQQQQQLEALIQEKSASLSHWMEKKASLLEMYEDLEQFNQLFKCYCDLPPGIPDESQHIKNICRERFDHGTNHQLKTIDQYLELTRTDYSKNLP